MTTVSSVPEPAAAHSQPAFPDPIWKPETGTRNVMDQQASSVLLHVADVPVGVCGIDCAGFDGGADTADMVTKELTRHRQHAVPLCWQSGIN